MNELAMAYIEYIAKLKTVKKPKMPKFDVLAYNDSDYILAIENIMKDYQSVDDFAVYEFFLKGD